MCFGMQKLWLYGQYSFNQAEIIWIRDSNFTVYMDA